MLEPLGTLITDQAQAARLHAAVSSMSDSVVAYRSLGGIRARHEVCLILRDQRAVAGTLQATNGDAGPYDRERLPLTALSTRYVATADPLELSELAAEAGPRARARGSARPRPPQ